MVAVWKGLKGFACPVLSICPAELNVRVGIRAVAPIVFVVAGEVTAPVAVSDTTGFVTVPVTVIPVPPVTKLTPPVLVQPTVPVVLSVSVKTCPVVPGANPRESGTGQI